MSLTQGHFFNSSTLKKEEFKTCFDNWFDSIRNYIYYKCSDEEIATDIAQEVFLKLWEKDIAYEGERTKSLLYKMAKDTWVSQYRKEQTKRKYQDSLDGDSFTSNQIHEMDYLLMKARYESTLKGLPNGQKEVFLMSRMEDLSYKEIASRLEIGVKAVEKRMSMALKTLRKALNYGE